jgi:cytochrome P450
MDEHAKAAAKAFSFHDAALMQNPVPFYDEIRGKCPVAHSDQLGGFYFVTTFVGAKRVYDDYKTFSSTDGTALPKQPLPLYPIDLDPPEQTRLRKLLNPLFIRDAAASHANDIQTVVDGLIDSFIADGEAELQSQFIHPTLSGVVLPFLGVPMADLPMLSEKVDYLVRHRADDAEGCAKIGVELGEYLLALTERRRAETPRNDILQTLVDGEIGGRPLTEMEILGVLTLTLFGGLDTTSAALTGRFCTLPAIRATPSGFAPTRRCGARLWRSSFATPLRCRD